jgi:16S rRNA (uracil1498-N3)-methyltransferase
MKSYTPQIRLYVSDDLGAGAVIALPKTQAHYLQTVMRCKAGDAILLFNGRDGEWQAEITLLQKNGGEVQVTGQTRPQAAEPDLWLCFAPIKFGRIDYLVEKATELGVSQLYPVQTARTVVSRINGERLRAHAVEAAEQSERLSVPELMPYQKLTALLADWPKERLLFYGDETGGGKPLRTLLPQIQQTQYALLIGPEGGFAPEELALLKQCPFAQAISLGPRILRADTAALAGLAQLGAWLE